MARLVIESGDEAGMMYTVGAEPILIGRGTECRIQVRDRRVSRHHAKIRLHRGACVVEDLDSRNGTFLNHQPLTGLAQLRAGDHLAVGGTSILYELDEQETSEKQQVLARVRLSTGVQHSVTAEKAVDSDTAPLILQDSISRDQMADPLQRLRVFYQVSDSLRGELDMDNLLWKIMDCIWRVVMPHRGIILIRSQDEILLNLNPVVVKLRHDTEDEIIISQGIVERCLTEKTAILMADAANDVRFSENDSIFSGQIRSVICTPLVASGTSLGAIYVDTQYRQLEDSHTFTGEDLDMMSGIANQAALALQNVWLHQDALKHQRMERELEIARDIQMNLLPQAYPLISGLDFAAACIPARQVGGDYYDFFQMDDNKTAIVVGDASGKGVPAAIFISMLRAALRTQARYCAPAKLNDLAAALNTSVCSDALPDNYATFFIMLYDAETREFSYTNAGHVPPLLIRVDGSVVSLDEGGSLLGVSSDSSYACKTETLNEGDVLMLYSDGVTDTHNLAGELFSTERLLEAGKINAGRSAADICDSIYESVVRFRESREAFDDLTLLIMKAVKPV